MRKSFTVRYERDETGWWVAQVKERPAAITQGRTIAEARRRIREALALALGDDAAAKRATLIDDVRLPADAGRALAQARAARARLETESKKAQESTAKAVRILLEGMHLSVRDAGDLIGISPQRVHRLAHENGQVDDARLVRLRILGLEPDGAGPEIDLRPADVQDPRVEKVARRGRIAPPPSAAARLPSPLTAA